jgi:nitrate reductase gamma subunit
MNNPSIQALLFIALPYAAMAVFVAGLVWRHRSPLGISSRSSQVFESTWLSRGTIPFHIGLGVLLVGHLLPLLFPAWWLGVVSRQNALLIIETAGAAAAILCIGGLVILLLRRIGSRVVRKTTRFGDLFVLALLIAQAGIGFAITVLHRWGAVWSVATVMPYLRSVFVLQPDVALMAGAPLLVTLHVTLAWILLAVTPYTRLVHVFSVPLGYLWRPPQKVVWNR